MNASVVVEAVIFLGRVLVGSVLVLAGVLKLKAGAPWFLRQLLAYDLVRGNPAILLARLLPALEVVCGGLLLFGFLTHLAMAVSFSLLALFTGAVTSAIWRDRPVNCGCFGRGARMSRARWTIVYRNLALMGLLLPIQTFERTGLSMDGWLPTWLANAGPGVVPPGGLTAVWLLLLATTVGLQLLLMKYRALRHHRRSR